MNNFKRIALTALMSAAIVGCSDDSDVSSSDIDQLRRDLQELQNQVGGGSAEEVAALKEQLARLNHYYVDNLNLAQVQMVYSHNSYDSRQDRWPGTDIEGQLDAGVRVLEFDLWDANGTIAHDSDTVAQHCADITACLDNVKAWSAANPEHAPILLQFEVTDNGDFVEPGEAEDAQLAARTAAVQSKVQLLADTLNPLVNEGKLITYKDSLKEIDELRGKFIVSLYRKYNTPYYQNRDNGFSKRQTITLNQALYLTEQTDQGNYYRDLLINNHIFCCFSLCCCRKSRWLGLF